MEVPFPDVFEEPGPGLLPEYCKFSGVAKAL
jgi:hypothetical protein